VKTRENSKGKREKQGKTTTSSGGMIQGVRRWVLVNEKQKY
jgi:hypothetical protein